MAGVLFFFFFPAILGIMGHLVQVGALKLSHKVTDLWVVFDLFCPQDRLQLGPEVTHCQFVLRGQSCCCFHQVTPELIYKCNSIWLDTPWARWGNSVLSITLSPTRPAQWSTTSLALGGCLILPHPFSAFVHFPAFVSSAPCPTPVLWDRFNIPLHRTLSIRL
jgi:hypothetical protein